MNPLRFAVVSSILALFVTFLPLKLTAEAPVETPPVVLAAPPLPTKPVRPKHFGLQRVNVAKYLSKGSLVLMTSQVTVCTTGCDFDNTQLQTALDAAVDGDEILLETGHVYTGDSEGYVLGVKCATPTWDCIIVRTGVTSTGSVLSSALFPADTMRMSPGYSGTLAKFPVNANNEAAIRTVYPGETGSHCASTPCVAKGWTLKWIEAYGNAWGQRTIVRFGTNKAGKEFKFGTCTYPDATPACWTTTLPGGETQDTLVELPQYNSLISSYVHAGDSFRGQHDGVLIAAGNTRLYRNYISNIKATGVETHGVLVVNGTGPYDFENNYIEASSINVFFGGTDTYLHAGATITGSPTTTTVTLTNPVWMHLELTTTTASLSTDFFSGSFVAITHAGTRYSGMTCTLSGSTCTLSPAMPVTPSAGDLVEWTWNSGGLTYKYNLTSKPIAWMSPILDTPTSFSASATTGGSLAGGTYCYVVEAVSEVNGNTFVNSDKSTESCATVGSSGKVNLSWAATANATGYIVFRGTSAGAENLYIDGITSTSYSDTGSTVGSSAPLSPTYWVVKNNWEAKNLDGFGPQGQNLIEGNIFDRSWCCTQNMIVSFKSWNQGDGLSDVSANVRNVLFRKNWLRHGDRCLNFTSTDAEGHPSGYTSDITISDIICSDLSSAWAYAGGSAFDSSVQFTSGNYSSFVGDRDMKRISLTHITILADDTRASPIWFVFNGTDSVVDLTWRDNLSGSQGGSAVRAIIDGAGQTPGPVSWGLGATGSSAASYNVWPGASSSDYTFSSNSLFSSVATYQAQFVSVSNCNNDIITGCALSGGSLYSGNASDSLDRGANITAIKALTDVAASGDETLLGGGGGGTGGETGGSTGSGHGRGPKGRIKIK